MREFGRKPYMDILADPDDPGSELPYLDRMRLVTDKAMFDQRLEKQSEMKKPYLAADYEGMEHWRLPPLTNIQWPWVPRMQLPRFPGPAPVNTDVQWYGYGVTGQCMFSVVHEHPDDGDTCFDRIRMLMYTYTPLAADVDIPKAEGSTGQTTDGPDYEPPPADLASPIERLVKALWYGTERGNGQETPKIGHVKYRKQDDEIIVYPPPEGWSYDIADGESDVHLKVVFHDPGGSVCSDDIVMECGCQCNGSLAFDDASTPDTIAPGGDITVYVTGGCPPFSWSVSGTGYSFASGSTSDRYNTLSCASGT